MYTLLLIDVQPAFIEADAAAIPNMVREIGLAKENQCPIRTTHIPYLSPLDDEGCGPVHESLQNLLAGYPHYRSVQKSAASYGEFDAAGTVLASCSYPQRFRVCGAHTGGWWRSSDGELVLLEGKVTTTGCVFDIVYGLTKVSPDSLIEVVQDACHEGRKGRQVYWQDFTNLPNVVLV